MGTKGGAVCWDVSMGKGGRVIIKAVDSNFVMSKIYEMKGLIRALLPQLCGFLESIMTAPPY